MMTINNMKVLNRVSQDVSRSDLFSVSPDMLTEEKGFNVRGVFDEAYFEQPEVEEHIRGLADSYKAGRYVPPIVVQVRNGIPYIRDGMHRRRALMLAISEGAEIKRVQVLEHHGDEAQQTLLLATINDGRPLSPMERAVIYDRLDKWGWTTQEIASSVRRTVKHVSQTLALLDMPIELKRMVQRNEIAATQATELFRQHGDDAVSMINKARENTDKGKVTKKDIVQVPRMTKKVQQAVRTHLGTVTARLAATEADDTGSVTLVLDADEAQEMLELRGMLGLDQENNHDE
jgi:ParB/RepB/Spo0J family partition protein